MIDAQNFWFVIGNIFVSTNVATLQDSSTYGYLMFGSLIILQCILNMLKGSNND